MQPAPRANTHCLPQQPWAAQLYRHCSAGQRQLESRWSAVGWMCSRSGPECPTGSLGREGPTTDDGPFDTGLCGRHHYHNSNSNHTITPRVYRTQPTWPRPGLPKWQPRRRCDLSEASLAPPSEAFGEPLRQAVQPQHAPAVQHHHQRLCAARLKAAAATAWPAMAQLTVHAHGPRAARGSATAIVAFLPAVSC